MPRINVRLDDVEDLETKPEGSYLVEILPSSKIKRSLSNEPKIGWSSKVMEGEYEGRPHYWETSLLPQALFNLKALLKAIDVEWDEDGFDLEDCFGKQVIIDVIVDTWKGEERNYARGYHRA